MLEKNTLKTVHSLLKKDAELRDNDMALMIAVWQKQYPELRSVNMSFLMFAYKFKKGHYTHFETIRRCRQRIQEEYPDLRGERYRKRKVFEEEVREIVTSPEFKRKKR